MLKNQTPELEGEARAVYQGFSAPYRGLPDEAFNGFRRFGERDMSSILRGRGTNLEFEEVIGGLISRVGHDE